MLLELDAFRARLGEIDAATEPWLALFIATWLGFISWALWHRTRAHKLDLRRDRLLREELEAYARFDTAIPSASDARAMAKRVCRLVSDKSAFRRSALLLRNAEGRLYVAGSAGMDDLAVATLTAWGTQLLEQERTEATGIPASHPSPALQEITVGVGVAAKCLLLDLPAHQGPPRQPLTDRATLSDICGRAILLPLRDSVGHMVGAMAVSHVFSVTPPVLAPWSPTLEEAVSSLQALAAKLARAIESVALADRLGRAEKLAGLGQLASGVAHELNNPLTAVLGYAELIAETSSEPRVRDDANTIVTEAIRMKEIIQNLVTFSHPATLPIQPIQLPELLRDVAASHASQLEKRHVPLVLTVGEPLPCIRGDAERLHLLLDHLLDNAVQAIGYLQGVARNQPAVDERSPIALMKDTSESHAIRLTATASHNPSSSSGSQIVHLIVSDTGPGFPDPSRVFDPFYTTRQPGEGSGLGLSICYGIVREHGGHISAFNLHPHGAAVVIELPVGEAVTTQPNPRLPIRAN